MIIRKAACEDIEDIVRIYNKIHEREEQGLLTTGWIRDIYPTRDTAAVSVAKGEMYVIADNDEVVAAARINQEQGEEYRRAAWKYDAEDEDVMVLHTLVVLPESSGKGYGRAFVEFYEKHASANNCHYLRMDTNARNKAVRSLYKFLGYEESDIVPCEFNGIKDVDLVCLEKKLDIACIGKKFATETL